MRLYRYEQCTILFLSVPHLVKNKLADQHHFHDPKGATILVSQNVTNSLY